jgi:hypothetical protein
MVWSQNKSKNGETKLYFTCFFLLVMNPCLDFTLECSKTKMKKMNVQKWWNTILHELT